MLTLILGLVLFLGPHSVRIWAEDWRTGQRVRWGENAWKSVYSLLSLLGLVLIIWGYGEARHDPVPVWSPPMWARHGAAALTLPAFVLWVASQVPGNALKARLQHPMLLGTKFWALAHLLANGQLADLVLFGSFLIWAVLDFRSARQRPSVAGGPTPSGIRTAAVLVLGIGAWAGFAFWAHAAWIGVSPFGLA